MCQSQVQESALKATSSALAPQERVGIEPALHLAEGFVEVLAAATEEKRLCQEREVLVTV
jgi:hypothetical protein